MRRDWNQRSNREIHYDDGVSKLTREFLEDIEITQSVLIKLKNALTYQSHIQERVQALLEYTQESWFDLGFFVYTSNVFWFYRDRNLPHEIKEIIQDIVRVILERQKETGVEMHSELRKRQILWFNKMLPVGEFWKMVELATHVRNNLGPSILWMLLDLGISDPSATQEDLDIIINMAEKDKIDINHERKIRIIQKKLNRKNKNSWNNNT